MKTFVTFVLSLFVLAGSMVVDADLNVVYAQSVPLGVGVGPTLGEMVVMKAQSLGYAVADPRIAATVEAISQGAAAAAAGIAGAAGIALGGVTWAGLGEVVGIAGFLVTPTSLGNDTVAQWQFNPNGTITVSSSGNPAVAPSFPVLTPGQPYWSSVANGSCAVGYCGSAPDAVLQAYNQALNALGGSTTFGVGACTVSSNGGSASCLQTMVNTSTQANEGSSPTTFYKGLSYSGPACDQGMATSGKCTSYVAPPAQPPAAPVTESPAAAAAGVSAGDAAEPLTPQIIAAELNALWSQAAALPGFSGLPFPVGAPVSNADATATQSAVGTSWPTVGDFTGPASANPGAGASPFGFTVGGTVTSTGTVAGSGTGAGTTTVTPAATATDPGSGAQVNLGPDPGIGLPTLEQTPSASMILAPILGLLPDLRTYGMPSHTSVCPEPSITLFDQVITVTTQCDLAEQLRPKIYSTFVLAFTLAALFIVLTA